MCKPIRFLVLLVVIFSSLFGSQLAHAAVYKYVDGNGKVHFTDKPPKKLKQKADVVKLEQRKTTSSTKFPRVTALTPIKNTLSENTRTVLLERVSIELKGEAKVKEVVGKTYQYTRNVRAKAAQLRQSDNPPTAPFPCRHKGKLMLSNAMYIFKNSELIKSFEEVFTENKYTVAGKKTFSRQQTSSSDLSLVAVVTDMKLFHCGSRSASNLQTFTQNATYMKVEWVVFDNLARQVVLKTTTEGFEDSFRKPARFNGAAISAELAFRQATNNLLAQQNFIDLLVAAPNTQTSMLDTGMNISDVNIQHGTANSSFIAKTGDIEKAAVTIRTVSGHGSGFLVSSPGYILTNQHVVENSKMVIVVQGGKEIRAVVLRSHPGRDVALLKLDSPIDAQPLQINTNPVRPGEEVYVVGTPLDEKLNFSITRGIISARRKLNNRDFYQTDAAINHGNSGGPVFNKSGNVIGITVARIETKDGVSADIGYVIPILDALDALEIPSH